MSTVAVEKLIEFRCSRCYQLMYQATEAAGHVAECPHCKLANDVPEATEDRLRNSDEIDAELLQVTEGPGLYADQDLSPEDVIQLSKARAADLMAHSNTGHIRLDEIYCDRWKRLLAVIVDVFFYGLATGISMGVGVFLANAGLFALPEMEEFANYTELDPIVFLGFFGLAFCFCVLQWCLIANDGQSVGKKVMGIKIVDDQGLPPGFFQGVFLRTWVTGLVCSFIPFGGLIDNLAIFRDPPRCLHDDIAKTYVVDAKALALAKSRQYAAAAA